jgi:hypothetical protein
MSKNDPVRFSSFVAILKPYKYAGKFSVQSDDLNYFYTGVERSIIDFLRKNHHLEFFFLELPNNVRLTSKLNRMPKISPLVDFEF